MSFDDKKFGTIFPVRDGVATGSANERQMLDAIGGAVSFRTRIQQNEDGSETMLRTKNGMPQFTTIQPPSEVKSDPLYMESGQLYFTYPGPENPDRSKAAKWRLLDISPSSAYLGVITPTEAAPGLPANDPALVDGQDSLAIAPPSPESKKVVAGLFPASMFSGKMRLFVQAQIGAKETPSYGMTVDASIGSPLLKYSYGGREIQFGLWPHLSVGIFAAQDGTFWLLSISSGGTANFTVTAYPIVILKRAKRLYDIYKSGAYDSASKEKIEAYLFAHSYIDLLKQSVIGGFSGSSGATLAYGWKFNSSGSEASIVVHETLGAGVPHGESLLAKTMTATFTYTSGSFQVSATTESGGEWTDGWGVYNIFVPDEETGVRLVSYSLAMARDRCKAPFSFSGVPIYGYFKNDVWTPVIISRNMTPGGSGESQSYSNFYVPSLYAGLYPAWYYGNFLASSGWTYSYKNLTDRWTMDISFDGSAVNGIAEFGSFSEIVHSTSDLTGESATGSDKMGFALSYGGGNGGNVSVPWTGDYAAADAAWARGEFPLFGAYVNTKSATFTWDQTDFTGARYVAWALVIPSSDCEAAYVAEKTYMVSGTSGVRKIRSGSLQHSRIAYGHTRDGNNTPTRYEFAGTHTCSATNSYAFTTTSNFAIPDVGLKVMCFNSTLSGDLGTPGSSYYALFNVDISYPYYDRGMYMRTSAGYRYIGSEGVKSPDSVGNLPFVGWA